jgi:hypothetical protein
MDQTMVNIGFLWFRIAGSTSSTRVSGGGVVSRFADTKAMVARVVIIHTAFNEPLKRAFRALLTVLKDIG